MAATSADRSFSEKKHLHNEWQTSLPSVKSGRARRVLRLLSYKYRELHRFSKLLGPADTVLDFGCGTGAYSHYVQQAAGATVIAADWSFTALQRLVRKNTGVLALCADLHHLPLKVQSISALFSIDTIGHLHHQNTALDEINRVCRSRAPLMLHSECADYRTRWPDRVIIRACGTDLIAKIDGHNSIRPAASMLSEYRRRFTVASFYSPAGLTGWLTGYPEKYFAALVRAKMVLPAALAGAMMLVKKVPLGHYCLRGGNMLLDTMGALLGYEGGGSCFLQARTGRKERRTTEPVQMSLDVVIATWKRSALLARLVADLLVQCRKDDRIIIVWQGSDKPLVPHDERICLLHLDKPSLPAARNAGIKAGKNPVVVFIDDDCELKNGFLDAYRNHYGSGAADAVAGYIDDPLFTGEAREPSLFNVATGEIFQQFNCKVSGPAITLMGANMSFLRSALEVIGGFDVEYRRNAVWEDVDMSFRLLGEGYAISYCADAAVVHLRHADGGCRADHGWKYLFNLFANTAYFSCTYVAMRHVPGWLHYWWYRLEYSARKKTGTGTALRLFRYDSRLLLAGLTGAFCGIVRFLLRGTRRGMPIEVTLASIKHFGSTT